MNSTLTLSMLFSMLLNNTKEHFSFSKKENNPSIRFVIAAAAIFTYVSHNNKRNVKNRRSRRKKEVGIKIVKKYAKHFL